VAESELKRNAWSRALEYLKAFRVVIINGPRQSGKSTLLRHLREETGGDLIVLDGQGILSAVRADPEGAVLTDQAFLYIDEIQLGGDALVRAIKSRVDDPGNRTTFVLAGSTNFLTVPTLSESLAGRAVFIDMWPLSQGEIRGRRETFIDTLTSDAPLSGIACETLERREYFELITLGGYPEARRLESDALRSAWHDSYIRTVVGRDIVELANLRRADELPRLLTYLTGKTAQEFVKAQLANVTEIERNRLDTYSAWLETVFLVRQLPAWSRNPLGKVTRTPKLHACDSGLAAHLHGVSAGSLEQLVAPLRGQLVETFVHNELLKQQTWNETPVNLFHWRDRDGAEVDLILETRSGLVCGVEVKASTTVNSDDFRWLRRLDQKLGEQFHRGIVFHLGERPLSFGPKLVALPLSALWSVGTAN
jgi:uncharacterized protein